MHDGAWRLKIFSVSEALYLDAVAVYNKGTNERLHAAATYGYGKELDSAVVGS